MTMETVSVFLGWCTIINVGILIWWFLFVTVAQDFTYRCHRRLFKISLGAFNAIHYGGMAVFKFGVLLFNLVPYLALKIVG